VAVPMPTPATRWRCSQCGNLTRFDVVRSTRVREFVHLDLAGEPRVEETELLAQAVEQVSCRWCAGTDTVEIVERVDAGTGPDTGSTAAGRGGSSDTA
jgi:hypothetical protein